MRDVSHSDPLPREQLASRSAWFPVALFLPVIAGILYMGGLTGFFKWEEKATTNAEFFRRVQIRNRIYGPLIWLKAHDPSGAARAVVLWQYHMCHNKTFDPSSLP